MAYATCNRDYKGGITNREYNLNEHSDGSYSIPGVKGFISKEEYEKHFTNTEEEHRHREKNR